jgi:iron complex transport system substrate-binding protein
MPHGSVSDVLRLACCWLLLNICAPSHGAERLAVIDDMGEQVRLEKPAQRIITLSPHAAELVFYAGAARRLIGVSSNSDYPAEARNKPRIGDHSRLDRERVLALQPDLAIAWPSGNQISDLDWLRERGIPVYQSEPTQLRHISRAIRHIGLLSGNAASANSVASAFDRRLRQLRRDYRSQPPWSAFFQVWPSPLFTIGKPHLINEALAVCQIHNVFDELNASAPVVSREAVIVADPQLIIAAQAPHDMHDPFAAWRPWDSLQAVKKQRFIRVSEDLIYRPTPRILDGIASICAQLPDASAPSLLSNTTHD